MKVRAGFVSNSSSSSFVITNKKISYDDVMFAFHDAWQDFLSEPEIFSSHSAYPSFIHAVSNEIMVTKLSGYRREIRKVLIKWFDEYACWNPWEPLKQNYTLWCKLYFSWHKPLKIVSHIYLFFCKLFYGTYLSEAMKSKVYMICKDNAVPQEVLEKLEKKFGKDIKIHYHMG